MKMPGYFHAYLCLNVHFLRNQRPGAEKPLLERDVVMYTANEDHKTDLHSSVHFHKELLMESPGVKVRIDE